MTAAELRGSVAGRWAAAIAIPGIRASLGVLGGLLALVGFATFAMTLWEAIRHDGGRAYDFESYWLAGQRFLGGLPLYAPVEINDPGAYRYTPTFAAAFAPLATIPELPLTWIYRALCLACLRYLVGSWRATGWALLFPPVSIELIALNLTLPIAAAGRMALRGPAAAAGWLPLSSTLKFGSALLVPYLWARDPERRTALVIGAVGAAALSLLHVALEPDAWLAFGQSLVQQSASANDAPFVGDQLLFLVPSTLGDFLLRAALAVVLTVVAIRRRWAWLAFVAATIAVPTLWVARLAPLVAVPRLWWEDRAANDVARVVTTPIEPPAPADAPPATQPAPALLP